MIQRKDVIYVYHSSDQRCLRQGGFQRYLHGGFLGFLVGKVNVDDEPDLAMRFGVMSIPTVIFLKDGKEFDRKVGVMPPQAYTAVLDANL